MKTFEVWEQKSNGFAQSTAAHIIEADAVKHENGTYVFRDSGNHVLAIVVTTPGMLVRLAESK